MAFMEVFPACAGMNRPKIFGMSTDSRIPRVRGDEPPAVFWRA